MAEHCPAPDLGGDQAALMVRGATASTARHGGKTNKQTNKQTNKNHKSHFGRTVNSHTGRKSSCHDASLAYHKNWKQCIKLSQANDFFTIMNANIHLGLFFLKIRILSLTDKIQRSFLCQLLKSLHSLGQLVLCQLVSLHATICCLHFLGNTRHQACLKKISIFVKVTPKLS